MDGFTVRYMRPDRAPEATRRSPNGFHFNEHELECADLETAARTALKHQPALLYAPIDPYDPDKGKEIYLFAHNYVAHVLTTGENPHTRYRFILRRLARDYMEAYLNEYPASYHDSYAKGILLSGS
jgi:hypothetical protein